MKFKKVSKTFKAIKNINLQTFKDISMSTALVLSQKYFKKLPLLSKLNDRLNSKFIKDMEIRLKYSLTHRDRLEFNTVLLSTIFVYSNSIESFMELFYKVAARNLSEDILNSNSLNWVLNNTMVYEFPELEFLIIDIRNKIEGIEKRTRL